MNTDNDHGSSVEVRVRPSRERILPLRRILHAVLLPLLLVITSARAGWVEDTPEGETVIHLTIANLPDPSRTAETHVRAEVEVVNRFKRDFPKLFQQRVDRYKADPARYGAHRWEKLRIELHQASGIEVPSVESDLLAIAAGVGPDVLFVNFRKSDSYIQQGFLYPLDKPEDGYLSGMSSAEIDSRIHPKIWPVIRRNGPGGQKHVWAIPYGGPLGKIVLFRKDLFDQAGLAYPDNNWTWDDLYNACRRLTDPSRGIYGLELGRGLEQQAYAWTSFLWSAGGDDLVYDEAKDEWRAVFDSQQAAIALDFYNRLCTEPWIDKLGRKRRGYVYRDLDAGYKWERGEIGMTFTNMEEKLFALINPEMTGLVPVPVGPDGHRGGELNSRMMGIFGGINDPIIRDAAWEYIRFFDCPDSARIRTRVMVEGGLGRFVNPKFLSEFGYSDLVRLAPKGWPEIFRIAVEMGRPEPYGRNCNVAYTIIGEPLQRAEEMSLSDQLPADREKRLAVLRDLLHAGVQCANETMMGIITPQERSRRTWTAAFMLAAIVLVFAWVIQSLTVAFRPPASSGSRPRSWGRSKFGLACLLLMPAVLSVLLWQYVPLSLGSVMAFQDYRLLGGSRWVWLDNFGDVLWDSAWWRSVWNSLRYSFLVISLTFLPPVGLAILLHEVPRGKLLFRTVYFLPAMITGLVTALLWKQFYDPSERGVLNALMLRIPAVGYLLCGLLCFWFTIRFARRLLFHDARWTGLLALGVGAALLYSAVRLAMPMMQLPDLSILQRLLATPQEPYRWLANPETAMLCCILPLIWAGIGPGSLIYLAALKGVADDVYDAAEIDGATFVDKVLFIVVPILKPLLIINFVGVFIGAWQNSATILAMTGGGANTTVADLNIFYTAFMHLRFGPATAMAWMLGLMLIGFTVYQLRILSRMEFRTAKA